ncbi:hypothetical protein G7Y89_g8517 [Cudoniella acicularis]|uniref:Uncharacterized protein n=1 Tax=Cudoniella acicularis TaxID=354080 RepID=A0A8H4RIJ2_9HELO|nr:hypothetical protein G7Y89_g8517 [Cudoniella acicularis]
MEELLELRRYGSRQSAGQGYRAYRRSEERDATSLHKGPSLAPSPSSIHHNSYRGGGRRSFRQQRQEASASDFACYDGPLSMPLELAIAQPQQDQKTLTQVALDTRTRQHAPIALQSVTFSQLSQENHSPTGGSIIGERRDALSHTGYRYLG